MDRRPLLVAVAALLVGVWLLRDGVHAVSAQSDAPMARADIEQLVKQAIEDRLAANDIPDSKLLGHSTRIAIREEMPSARLRMGPGALPHREGYEFYLISQATAQMAADGTARPAYFIAVDEPAIREDTATVLFGADMVLPRQVKAIKLCCCTGHGQFRRTAGRWTFVTWSSIVCG